MGGRMKGALQKTQSPVAAGQSAGQEAEAPIVVQPADLGKAEATLMAQLALRGHATHKLTSGGFLVVRQGCSRHCSDIEALEAFARQVGAIRADQAGTRLRSAPKERDYGD